MEAIISTDHLSKIFNKGKSNEVRPVDEVSVQIPKGSCTLLKGPSGSGKTTLLTMLSCMSKPTSGTFHILGKQVSSWSEKFLTTFRREHIGVVFQQFNLIRGMTAGQNIALPLFPIGHSHKALTAMAHQAAKKVNINHRFDFKIENLSGGEQQRVALARALVSNPSIIFADEPTSHLDTENSEAVLRIFEELKEQGTTIILTTHDPLVVNHPLVDHMIEMKDGKLLKSSLVGTID